MGRYGENGLVTYGQNGLEREKKNHLDACFPLVANGLRDVPPLSVGEWQRFPHVEQLGAHLLAYRARGGAPWPPLRHASVHQHGGCARPPARGAPSVLLARARSGGPASRSLLADPKAPSRTPSHTSLPPNGSPSHHLGF